RERVQHPLRHEPRWWRLVRVGRREPLRRVPLRLGVRLERPAPELRPAGARRDVPLTPGSAAPAGGAGARRRDEGALVYATDAPSPVRAMPAADHFSATYREARDRFLAAASAA